MEPSALLDVVPIQVKVFHSLADADVARRKQPQCLLEYCLHIRELLQVAILWHSVPPKRIHLLQQILTLCVSIGSHISTFRIKDMPYY
jgi:hypothetical protein